jgi:hypothetical protein
VEKTGTTDCVAFPGWTAPFQARLPDVLASLLRRPGEMLIRRWNWKSALLSPILRSALFLGMNLSAGWDAAAAAGSTEFAYRALIAGFHGAITQSFRHVEPKWQATLTVLILMPALNHTLEFLLHWLRGTPNLAASIAASVGLTVLSTTFNLFVMRRGALVTGPGGKPLASDLRALPGLIAAYLLAAPTLVWRSLRRRERRSVP